MVTGCWSWINSYSERARELWLIPDEDGRNLSFLTRQSSKECEEKVEARGCEKDTGEDVYMYTHKRSTHIIVLCTRLEGIDLLRRLWVLTHAAIISQFLHHKTILSRIPINDQTR